MGGGARWPSGSRDGHGDDDDPGLIRLDFGERDPSLEEISWDEFFEKFDQSELEFLYEEETTSADDGRLSQVVERPTRH